MSASCVFCKIVERTIPSPLVYEDEHVVAFRDLHPQAPTHILVVPRRHIQDLSELAQLGDAALGTALLSATAKVAATAGIADSGFRVVANTGENAGQSVAHLHLHVLGGRPLSWPPG